MATTAPKVMGYLPNDTPPDWSIALAWFPARPYHVPRDRLVRTAYAL